MYNLYNISRTSPNEESLMTGFASKIDSLLKASQADDTPAIEAIIDEYYEYIYRLTISILQDRDAAEDASQDTFIAAFLNLNHYRRGSNMKAWLSTIAVNNCRDRLRKRKRQQANLEEWEFLEAYRHKNFSPEEAAIKSESDSSLWALVNNLGEKHRIPIILRYVHDLPIREIAEILRIREGTVHSRLHYAIRKLQKHIEPEENPIERIKEVLP